METLGFKLSAAEQHYFSELFTYCDVDNQGKIVGSKVSELFLTTQLPSDALHQITEMCGAKRLGHFGRSQFYIALKLIAAAQAGLPLKPETFSSGTEIPLPTFGKTQECSASNADNKHGSLSNQVPSQLPPLPPKGYNRFSSQRAGKGEGEKLSDHQLQVQSQSAASNRGDRSSCSPESASSPLTSQMIHDDKTWTLFHNQDSHLSWTQFEEHHHLLGNEEDSSERLSSDEEYDVWTITDEQKDYYANQFKSMQPELKSKISGSTAKEFFEKSKLPVHELSKIWQLSDVDKDGALTLDEFCTAMHLVVLRRNKIELPDTLPSSLLPRKSQKVVEENSSFPSAPPQPFVPLQTQVSASPKQRTAAEVLSPQNKESFTNVQWTKFNDSPTSCMSSPGMKPVNFDFSAASVEQDPRILHPVALRLSPDGQPVAYGNDTENLIEMPEEVKPVTITSQPQNVQRPIPRKPTVPGPEVITAPCQTSVDVVGHSGVSSFSGLTASSASQGSLSGIQLPKKEPPPPPPPRSNHNHARSSSLDLNQLGKSSSHFLGIPPAVPPRISPNSSSAKRTMENQIGDEFIQNHSSQIDFADFANFVDPSQGVNLSQPQLKSGAFEIYKKPQSSPAASSPSIISSADVLHTHSLTSASDDSTAMLVHVGHSEEIYDRKRHVSAPLALFASTITTIPKDKRELQSAIRAHRERNMMLTLMNNELNQELSEVMEERIALEIQLEPLKPFS